jgi:hypothetical protein
MSIRAIIHDTNSRLKRARIARLGLIIAITIGCFVFLTAPFLVRYFAPPVVLTEEMLNTLRFDSLPPFKVLIQGDSTDSTGKAEQITRKITGITIGQFVIARYGVLFVGKRFLLVKTFDKIDESVTDYSGFLVPSNSDQVGRQVQGEILQKTPTLSDAALPFILDTSVPPWPWIAGLIAEVSLIMLALSRLPKVLGKNFNNHPITKSLRRFGDSEAILNEIDDELLHGESDQVGYLSFTDSWLIYKMGSTMEFERLNDVMWIYKSITSYNGRMAYSVYIWDRSGEMIGVVGRTEQHVDAMMDAAARRAPWAYVGHNPKVENAWKSDRARFAGLIDERRARMSSPQ